MDFDLLVPMLGIAVLFALVIFIVVALGAYLITPIFVRRQFSQRLPPLVNVVSREADLPTEASSYFDTVSRDLAQLGFDEKATLELPGNVDQVCLYVRIYANSTTKELAQAVANYTPPQRQAVLHESYVQFGTRYLDDAVVVTRNHLTANVYPPARNVTVVSAPWLQDHKTLYRAHSSLADWKFPNKTRKSRLDEECQGNAVAFQAAAMRELFDAAVSTGYYRYVENDDTGGSSVEDDNPYVAPGAASVPQARYEPTIKGAYLMTWKLLWPVRSINRWSQIRKSRRMLSAAGFSID